MEEPVAQPGRIHPDTEIGPVHYTVADLERQVAFYSELLGFHVRWSRGETASLGTRTHELLRLTQVAGAKRIRGTSGLYHTAFLVPNRLDLAYLMKRIAETRTPIQGTSNHGTHLAIYLPDPEGNGVELAWDLPRDVWPMKDGKWLVEDMPRAGIDIQALLGELGNSHYTWEGLPSGSKVGHVHLHVSNLDAAQKFYSDLLGFDVVMRHDRWGALFVSAGGYHHHIGMNVWLGPGIPPPPDEGLGLRYFTILVPDEQEEEAIVSRLRGAGTPETRETSGLLFKDPAGISVRFINRRRLEDAVTPVS